MGIDHGEQIPNQLDNKFLMGKEDIKPTSTEAIRALAARQVNRYVELGFHEELGLKENAYRARLALPKKLDIPATYKGGIPLVVDSMLTLPALIRRAGIREHGTLLDNILNKLITTDHPTDGRPYLAWTHDGSMYQGDSVQVASAKFSTEELPSPLEEAISLFLLQPGIFENGGIVAAGSRLTDGRFPRLYVSQGQPHIDAHFFGVPNHNYYGILSSGKGVVLLGPQSA